MALRRAFLVLALAVLVVAIFFYTFKRTKEIQDASDGSLGNPGLLRDVQGKYYTSVLKPEDAAILGTKAWDDVKKDAAEKNITPEQYLQDIQMKMRAFRDSRQLHDREELLKAMKASIQEKGSLAMLLGGSNVGKSMATVKVVEELNKPDSNGKHMNLAVLVDGRRFGGDLNACIQKTLEEYLRKYETWPEALKRSMQEELQAVTAFGVEVALKQRQVPEAIILIEKFVSLAEQHGMRPFLFLDEANSFFLKDSTADPDTQTVVKELIMLTKQTARLTVFMAATEHMFPFKMQRYNFHVDKTSKMILASEVPPPDMLTLCEKLGLGKHVANGIMSACGGHVWLTLQAVENLVAEKEEFTYGSIVPADARSNVMKCLKHEIPDMKKRKNKMEVQKTMLWKVAVNGFMSLEDVPTENSVIHTMLENNVVAFVGKDNTKAVGLAASKWGKADYGIVPASQQMRLVIIDKLLRQLE